MLRAALYARFSSENQREESILAQFRDSTEYCKNTATPLLQSTPMKRNRVLRLSGAISTNSC